MTKTVKKRKSLKEHIDEEFKWDRRNISILFLGVGLIMFILNITTIISFIPYIKKYGLPLGGFYTSLLSSMFLMGYSIFNIYDN